jgi:hypothetical protein
VIFPAAACGQASLRPTPPDPQGIFIGFNSRKFVLPIMTDLSQMLPSIVIMQTVLAG